MRLAQLIACVFPTVRVTCCDGYWPPGGLWWIGGEWGTHVWPTMHGIPPVPHLPTPFLMEFIVLNTRLALFPMASAA